MERASGVHGDVVRLTYMGSECSDVGVTYDHEVRLDEPLGGLS